MEARRWGRPLPRRTRLAQLKSESNLDGPAVRAFNLAVSGACASESPILAIAMLGMIEELFAGISSAIGRSIVTRGWLSESELIHYPAHERLDLEHSESFHRLVRHAPETESLPGLHLGARLLLGLYDGLLAQTRPQLR
jgi:pyrroloquinoline-quinone synthase